MAHSQNRLGPSLKLVQMALAAAPTAAGYHNTLGIILGDLRQWEESFAAFAKATELDPAYFDAYRNLAVAEQGDPARRGCPCRGGGAQATATSDASGNISYLITANNNVNGFMNLYYVFDSASHDSRDVNTYFA